jgi:pSer/pThr/pTyr-binding forkhead associated (FHA) protein
MALVPRLPDGRTLRFTSSFYVGREPGCDVELTHSQVSRRHAQVSIVNGEWLVRDLQSSNGTFVDGRRVEATPIGNGVVIQMGAYGPALRIEPEEVAPAPRDRPETVEDDLDAYAERYFGSESDDDESVGGRTLMIRKAYQKVQQQQRRTHRLIIAAIALIAAAAGGYAIYAHRALSKQMAQAQDIFYGMKQQDVLFAELEQKLAQSGNHRASSRSRHTWPSASACRTITTVVAGLSDRKLNEKEKLVMRVTRMFGECDDAVTGLHRRSDALRSEVAVDRQLRARPERAQSAGYPPRSPRLHGQTFHRSISIWRCGERF